MKIYSMTATFGKLSHQTLTLEPGLNVIHAPNEWGKSTWCAFLVAMLYGIDTRERTTQTALADKERYAPWSGEAMSGRIDLHWNGRDITIERRTKGRAIFGDFRAYETQSGLPVPELTAANCGEVLLGIEKSVFTRCAFIRLTDLPVTQDESLRRRLNALVTTGDESEAADALAQKLKDLKNRCRHNKTGLLPQAEAQRDTLENKLRQLQELQLQTQRIQDRQSELEEQIRALENHEAALAYAASARDAEKVAQANAARDEAKKTLDAFSAHCATLPAKEDTAQTLQQLEQLQLQWAALEAEVLPQLPDAPTAPAAFEGMSGSEALQQAKSDKSAFDMLSKPLSPVMPVLAVISLLAAVGMLFVKWPIAIPFGLLAIGLLFMQYQNKTIQARDRLAVCARYGVLDPQQWIPLAQDYMDAVTAFTQRSTVYETLSDSLGARKDALMRKNQQLTGGKPLSACIAEQNNILAAHTQLQEAQHRWKQASDHADALAAVAKVAAPPALPDTLTLSPADTQRGLADASAEHRQLHLRLGQCMGQMESLGQEDVLSQQLHGVQERIAKLEDTYSALTIALETLGTASNELQRRFAPRIAQRAQALFSKLTHGRYDRLQLTQDLSVHAGAQDEDTLRTALWRSDGTADQLYLALRLAVAAELTPNAPLVLDDALVRFDDDRLASALGILKESAQSKQILLFTCQKRELQYISSNKNIDSKT